MHDYLNLGVRLFSFIPGVLAGAQAGEHPPLLAYGSPYGEGFSPYAEGAGG